MVVQEELVEAAETEEPELYKTVVVQEEPVEQVETEGPVEQF